MQRTVAALALFCFAASFLAPSAHAVPPDAGPSALETLLHDTFAHYRSWGRVDDELRWAPWLCRMPFPSATRESHAEAGTPHAQKVYFVYARDRAAYLATTRERRQAPIGEVVVKESFLPRELGTGEAVPPRHPLLPAGLEAPGSEFAYRTLSRDGHTIAPGTFAGLYVLAKTGARGSDHGWEYGTMTPDGTITAMGRIASCMGCHDGGGTHDRLFGLDGGFEQ